MDPSAQHEAGLTCGVLGKENEEEVIGGKRVRVVRGRKSADHEATGLKERSVWSGEEGGSRRRHSLKVSCSFCKVKGIGGMPTRRWRGSTGVIWKQPLIVRTASFWVTWKILRTFLVVCGENHAGKA